MPETSTKKRLSPTVYYLLAGLAASFGPFALSGRLLDLWQTGAFLAPLSLAAIHALVLGSMLTVAFGVLYQIVPIAFQAPPLPRHVLYWHLPIHLSTVAVMVIGFWGDRLSLVAIGGSLLIVNAAAYFCFLLASYARARNRTRVHRWLTGPFAALALTLVIGLWQAVDPAQIRIETLGTHVLLGGLAFWGGLVLVLSYKLIPMFAISHGYRSSLLRTITLYYGGLLALLAGIWTAAAVAQVLRGIGALLTLLGLTSFAWDVVAILRARKRRRLVLPVVDALLATVCLLVSCAIVVAAVGGGWTQALPAAAYGFTFGGLLPLMFAYTQKIVPFLWFEYRFSRRPERRTAPLIDDMVPKVWAQSGFFIFYAGVAVGLLKLSGALPPDGILASISAVLLTLGSVLLFLALQHVLTIGGPRPADDAAADGNP